MSKFEKALEKLNICLNKKQLSQFQMYYEMLIETNKVMNLTAITEYDEVVDKHFVDSLSLIQAIDLNQPLKVIDVGTGAGFPGIPLKIAFPELKITLADSLNKRILFLEDVIKELGLTSISTVHGRAEDLACDVSYREKFDLCVSRAVANLSTLVEYCLPFVQIDGKFISYKSGDIESEVQASKKACNVLGGKLDKIYKFELEQNKRSFVIIKKIKATPKKYPRKAGTPSRDPIQ